MRFYQLLEKYDYLRLAFNYVLNNNGESTFNPYHNLNHLMVIVEYVYKIGEPLLTSDELKDLIVTAMFHDFRHTGGKENDEFNINLAKEGLINFVGVDGDATKMIDILLATQFPYIIKTEDLTLQQMIIRDADLCQLLEPTRIQFNILGLQKEIGLTYSQILNGQISFIKNIKFNTKIGEELYNKEKSAIKAELDILLRINN